MALDGSDATLEDLRRAHAAGDPDLLGRLARAIESRRQSKGGHKAFGQLCEEAGAANLAVTCYQLSLRDDPADTEALARLSEISIEQGHLDRAQAMAARWYRASPDDGNALKSLCEIHLMRGEPGPVKELLAAAAGHDEIVAAIQARLALESDEDPFVNAEEGSPLLPAEADVARFAHLFAGRENVYARQWSGAAGKTGYTPVREPLTMSVARNHLLGNITVGVYPVRLDNRVTFLAIDVDITKRAIDKARGRMKEASRLRALAANEGLRLMGLLEKLGFQPLLEDSGYKGRHLWIFLEAPEEASVVKRFGSLFLAVVPPTSMDIHFEFFPKQARIKKGIGNLIKLPLGIHRKSGRKSRLLGRDGQPVADPYASLRRVKKTPLDILHGAILDLRQREIPPSSALGAEVETADQATVAVPAPPPAEPAFTEADLDRDPEVAHLFGRCAVLRKLKDKVFKHRKLTHDEQVALRHTLGHSGAGVLAVNYLLSCCVDVDAGAPRSSAPWSWIDWPFGSSTGAK